MKQAGLIVLGILIGVFGFWGFQTATGASVALPSVGGGGNVAEIKGVSFDGLKDEQKTAAIELFNEQSCSGCPGSYSLAQCLNVEKPNAMLVAAANLAVRNLRAGRSKEQAAQVLTRAVERQPRQRRPAEDDDKVYEVSLGDAYVKGPEDAPITIVEFSDFQCPFCSRANNTVEQVFDAYPGKVKVAFKHFPLSFHKQAKGAAAATEAAGEQGKLWEIHDKVFQNQRNLLEEDLVRYAEQLGLDVEKFKADMKRSDILAKVDKHIAEGRSLGVTGTPTFFVNGKKLKGAKPFSAFQTAINEALKEAEKS